MSDITEKMIDAGIYARICALEEDGISAEAMVERIYRAMLAAKPKAYYVSVFDGDRYQIETQVYPRGCIGVSDAPIEGLEIRRCAPGAPAWTALRGG